MIQYKCSKFFLAALSMVLLTYAVHGQDSSRRPRQVSSAAGNEATVAINQQFANSFLNAIFDNLKEPSVSLGRAEGQAGCGNVAILKREVAGVRTAVRFENGRIAAPLAFAGSYYSSLLGCIQFEGWANANITLEFDRGRQALVGRIRLENVHLTNVPELISGQLLGLAQTAIDNRYNPFTVVTLEQMSTRVPIAPAGGALRFHAKEIRPEITPGLLTLHLVYEFVGTS
ncbi:MAG: hypothetical protein QOE77_1572 [Blastocatellia bacterium]|jgi:hypothetical protein|nr:hypothetical protein [Blastocatellia bacterium]